MNATPVSANSSKILPANIETTSSYTRHLNSAICALFFTILCAIQLVMTPDLLLSMAIFFPLSAACLLKTCLEARLAYDIYRQQQA